MIADLAVLLVMFWCIVTVRGVNEIRHEKREIIENIEINNTWIYADTLSYECKDL